MKVAEAALMARLHYECQPDRGDVFAFVDDCKSALVREVLIAERARIRAAVRDIASEAVRISESRTWMADRVLSLLAPPSTGDPT